jgi:hypothetical protein
MTMKYGMFGPIARSAQEVWDDILALSGLDPVEVAADNFEEVPGAMPPVARWTCDVREVRTFEVVGQVEADTEEILLGILGDAGIRTKEKIP